MNETVVTIIGNVCDVPTRRVLEGGATVTNFRLASTARRFDRTTGSWADGDSVFVSVACWRALGENTARSLTKGDPVVVHGRLCTRAYELNGQKRSSFELVAYSVGHDLSRGTTSFHRVLGGVPVTYEVTREGSGHEESGPDGEDTAGDRPGNPGLDRSGDLSLDRSGDRRAA